MIFAACHRNDELDIRWRLAPWSPFFLLLAHSMALVASNNILLQLTRATTEKTASSCPEVFMASDCSVIFVGYICNQSCVIIFYHLWFPAIFMPLFHVSLIAIL